MLIVGPPLATVPEEPYPVAIILYIDAVGFCFLLLLFHSRVAAIQYYAY